MNKKTNAEQRSVAMKQQQNSSTTVDATNVSTAIGNTHVVCSLSPCNTVDISKLTNEFLRIVDKAIENSVNVNELIENLKKITCTSKQ